MCHVSHVTFFLLLFFQTILWSLSVKGLLSTGPTPSSVQISSKHFHSQTQGLESLRECSLPTMCHMTDVICHMSDFLCHIKGGTKKQGRMKLLLKQILKYFTEVNYIFWKHQCIVEIIFLLIQNKLFIDVEEKKYLAKNNFQCALRCPIENTNNF